MTVSVGGQSASKEYIVKGIIKSKVDQISQRMFVLDSSLRQLLPVNQWEYQEIAVNTIPGGEVRLAANARNFVGSRAARVQTSSEAIPTFLRQIEQTFNILGNALSSIALIVASITIFIVIFINAVTRRKFIGIMKGIGIEPRAIQAAYVFQAIFYGVVGSVIGLITTFAILKPYFDAHPIDFPFSDGILAATWSGSLLRVGILLLVTLAAGFIPATIIVRKNTLDSILGR
jgi:acetoin utilization transport system permease protein